MSRFLDTRPFIGFALVSLAFFSFVALSVWCRP